MKLARGLAEKWPLGVALWAAAVVGYGIAFKRGWLPVCPPLFAGMIAVLIACAAVLMLRSVLDLVTARRSRIRTLGTALLSMGLVVALGAGMTNWLRSMQGVVIVGEGDTVELAKSEQVQHLELGWLSDLDEMKLRLRLDKLELASDGEGGFTPVSVLTVQQVGQAPRRLELQTGSAAAVGSLRLHQGAFGFSPRIVIIDHGESVFDHVVPFVTRREGARGVAFVGQLLLEAHQLELDGVVDLRSMDEAMRGHATLSLELRRQGGVLGRGRLLPGHFAEVGEGYRVGFAGLERWSEIDVSRRSYPAVILAGLAMLPVGAVIWLTGVLKKR